MSARRTVVVGGIVAGLLDITFAIVQWTLAGSTPARVLQGIASGLLGRASYQGGWKTAALGLALHLFIATTASVVYYGASRPLRALTRQPFVFGPLYGIAVYFFMQLVVLPLSEIPWKPHFTPTGILLGFAAHIFCIGIPIALTARLADRAAER
jgi:hypothetical protein